MSQDVSIPDRAFPAAYDGVLAWEGTTRRTGVPRDRVEPARSMPAVARPAVPQAELELLRDAIQLLPEAVAVFDPEDRYVFWNQKYAETYGRFAPQPWRGQRFDSYLCDLLDLKQFPAAIGREPLWLAERMAHHQLPFSNHEHEIAGSRWLRVEERRLAGGGTIGIRVDITEHKRREFQLAHMAHHDALTGLANRVLLRERIEIAVEQASIDDPAALVFLDLDRFKAVNDTLGHAVGDALLREVAVRLRPETEPDDTAARLGGDEFAVVLRHAGGARSAEALVAHILARLSAPYEIMSHRIVIGASAGIALIPDHGQDAEALLRRADVGLYCAKDAGRGVCRTV